VFHKGVVGDGRMKCIFSRVISVIPDNEGVDLNLNNSYYIIIGTVELTGVYVCLSVCIVLHVVWVPVFIFNTSISLCIE